jgi:RNA recognition motif-containing protein
MASHVIIRLQNLPLDARSVDIRKFFENLVIPDGGVHIIGGERGDAFIAFQSDEDARLAMQRDSHFLCNSRVKLQLSSKTEMQNVIAASRNQQPAASLSPTLLKPNKDSSSSLSASASPHDLLSSLTKLITSANKEPSSTNDILKDILLKTSSAKRADEPSSSTNISLNQIMGLINQTKNEANSGNQAWVRIFYLIDYIVTISTII